MPTARELLEQADALMRRNRGGDTGIPVLTDVIPDESAMPSRAGPSTRERTGPAARGQIADARAPRDWEERNEAKRAPENAPAEDGTRAAVPPEVGEQTDEPAVAASVGDIDALAINDDAERDLEPPLLTDALANNDDAEGDLEPPLLTDVVEEIAINLAPLPPAMAEGDPSAWLGPDTIDPALHSITGLAPDTVGVVPPVTSRAPEPRAEAPGQADERDPMVSRTLRAAGSEPTPPPTGSTPPERTEIPAASPRESVPAEVTNDEERWRALAEQISMQVLQRLDLFIDTGLKTKLASHLQPIVARASAELVETINVHVGQLVQTYIAEAIEREIAQWRKQQK
jgi:hypothetical protein